MRGWPVVTSIALVEWLRRHRSPAADLQKQLDGRTRELAEARKHLAEALEQQTATAEVLRVISSTPGELEPVFEAMLVNAVRLCEASFGVLFRFEDGAWRAVAMLGVPPAFAEFWQRGPHRAGPQTGLGRIAATRESVHITDAILEQGYAEGDPIFVAAIKLGGFRTALGVPMLKDENLIGAIFIYRQEVRPFTDKQIALVQNYANQAVIAIENARLLDETREALERQTASAEVLQVISSSPGDLKPVFNQMLAKAMRLCEAQCGFIYQIEQGAMRAVAEIGVPPAFAEYRRNNLHTGGAATPADVMRATRKPAHVRDARDSEPYRSGNPNAVAGVDLGGARTVLYVPMIKNDDIVGVINVYRQEVRPFTQEQISLLENFASQAVIAIENARLFNETQEALARQSATADVLRVINSSPGDLAPVFGTILEKAHSLCAVSQGSLLIYDGDKFRAVAIHGIAEAFAARLRQGFVPGPNHPSRQLLKGGRFAQVADCAEIDDPVLRAAVEVAGIRTVLFIPLWKEGHLLGQIAAARREISPFTEKEVSLLENFAAQAVIAIENARLLNETAETLERQTATADILKVIASSPTDLQPVFDTIAERANRLIGGRSTAVVRFNDGVVELVAFTPIDPQADAALRASFPVFQTEFQEFELTRTGDVLQLTDSEAGHVSERSKSLARARGFRSVLSAPLLDDRGAIGAINVARKEPGEFADHHKRLLRMFADQAVIAISNVNLFEQVQERTRELSKSLDDLRTAQDRLVQTEKLASLGQLTAGIAHEIKNPLNFVNNFSALSVELTDELNDVLKQSSLADKIRAEADELTNLLKDNLTKIVQHGKRADSIVKNMLLHSREGSGERRSADINALVGESLNLAYHGARAEKPSFAITLKHDLDPNAGALVLYPQEITRALLNLISNGFYAATRRKVENGDDAFEPVLSAATRNLGETVEIRIRDNGPGIPPDVREKMFNPFFTTKPTGEGTGLGLSMTHDIVVKQHGGRIDVETEPGVFTEFIITLPRGAGLRK